MHFEIEIRSERIDTPFVSFDTELFDPDDGPFASIGVKEFKGIGQFRYRWLLEYMDVTEMVSLRDALDFAIKSLKDAGPKEDETDGPDEN